MRAKISMITNISSAIITWNGPNGNPAYIAEAVCPNIDAIPEKTGGKNAADTRAGTVSSANEPTADGILIKPPTAHNATNNAVNVILLNRIFSVLLFLIRPEYFCAADIFIIGYIHPCIGNACCDKKIIGESIQITLHN